MEHFQQHSAVWFLFYTTFSRVCKICKSNKRTEPDKYHKTRQGPHKRENMSLIKEDNVRSGAPEE